MSPCRPHIDHEHVHGPGCGHRTIWHGDHADYVHDGHLHRLHDGHVDECVIPVDGLHPVACTPDHICTGHAPDHVHGPGCGHEPVPHGDHVDYVVEDHLHHPHRGHCDMHGDL